MEHSFNVQFAQKYGIEEAIIVHNFYFWLRKNIANEKHLHNGRYWAYNSNKAFTQLFPYINKTKIFRVLKHLEEEGILLKDYFNKDARDRTLWYAFSDSGIEILNFFGYDMVDFKMANCIVQNEICTVQNETTIPDNKHTDNNKEKEIDKSISKKEFENAFIERMYKLYPTKCPKRNVSLGKSRKDKQRIAKLLNFYSMEDIELVFKREIEEKYDKQYMLNFSTFLNNFPDPTSNEQPTLFTINDNDTTTLSNEKIIINGQIYR